MTPYTPITRSQTQNLSKNEPSKRNRQKIGRKTNPNQPCFRRHLPTNQGTATQSKIGSRSYKNQKLPKARGKPSPASRQRHHPGFGSPDRTQKPDGKNHQVSKTKGAVEKTKD